MKNGRFSVFVICLLGGVNFLVYTIYHIFGKKVGCTKHYPYRCYGQGAKDGEFGIIDTWPLSVGDKFAGDREWEWSDAYGYPKGQHYSNSGSNKDIWGLSKLSKQEISDRASQAGKIGGPIGFKVQHSLGLNPFQNSKIQSQNGKKAAASGKIGMLAKITCPHCNKTGQLANMKRYHFDNCKGK